MTVELISQTHTANIYGVYESSGKPIGTVQCTLCGMCQTIAYSLTSKYTRREILKAFNQEKKRERLFNELFEYYGTEHVTWQAVQKALDNNLTAAQVKKIF